MDRSGFPPLPNDSVNPNIPQTQMPNSQFHGATGGTAQQPMTGQTPNLSGTPPPHTPFATAGAALPQQLPQQMPPQQQQTTSTTGTTTTLDTTSNHCNTTNATTANSVTAFPHAINTAYDGR